MVCGFEVLRDYVGEPDLDSLFASPILPLDEEEVRNKWPISDDDDQFAFDHRRGIYALQLWPSHLRLSRERMRATEPLQQLWQSFFIRDGAVSILYKHWCYLGGTYGHVSSPGTMRTLVIERPFNSV